MYCEIQFYLKRGRDEEVFNLEPYVVFPGLPQNSLQSHLYKVQLPVSSCIHLSNNWGQSSCFFARRKKTQDSVDENGASCLA